MGVAEVAPTLTRVRRPLTECIEAITQFIELHDLRTEEVLSFAASFGQVTFHLNYDDFCRRGWHTLSAVKRCDGGRWHHYWEPKRGIRITAIQPEGLRDAT